jgi:hypothetical protein
VQGTARPTHYYVIRDAIGFKVDEIRRVSNPTQAVSLVSPAYCVDVACQRKRCYLRKLINNMSTKWDDGERDSGWGWVWLRRSGMSCRKHGGCEGGASLGRASRKPCFILEPVSK